MFKSRANSFNSIFVFIFLTLSLSSFFALAGPGGTKGKSGNGGKDGGEPSKSISASDDYLTVKANGTGALNVLKDSDTGFKISVTQLNGSDTGLWVPLEPSNAKAYISESGDLTYDPNGAFDNVVESDTASDSLTYTITDKYGNKATATVHVTVEGVKPISQNHPPVAMSDTAILQEDSSVTIDVLVNDFDHDGDDLIISSAGPGLSGEVTTDGNHITYRPDPNFNGTDSFSYTISDGNNNTAQALVSLTVTAINDAPVANADSFTTQADQSLTGNVLINDTDIDGDSLRVQSYPATSAQGASISMQSNGAFTYTPRSGYVGSDKFSYVVTDSNGALATGQVFLTIQETSTVPYYITGVIYEFNWWRTNYPDPYGTPDIVTYAFLESVPNYYDESLWVHDGFRAFSVQQRETTRNILALIESFANITFVETSVEEAEMTFGLANAPGVVGVTYTPSSSGIGNNDSDVWIDADFADDSFVPGTNPFWALIHEVGHALAIDHPTLPAAENNRQYSVMSYSPHQTMGGDITGYQVYDIAALQYVYGANSSHAIGNDVYTFAATAGLISTIWDAGGYDVFDMSAATYGVVLNLSAGAFSTVTATGSNNLAIAYDTVIEEAIGGAYDDQIISSAVNNTLTGGNGNDVFVFHPNWGQDRITDFARGQDRIDLRPTGLSLSEVDISSSGSQTVINHGANTITLLGVSSLSSEDFIF